MQVETLSSGDQGHRLFRVGAEFVRGARFAGIVARREDAAGEVAGVFESGDVVALPAVERNLNLLDAFNRLVDVYSKFRITFFRERVRLFNLTHCVYNS